MEFWDSRLSGKKKLSLDENQLILVKDQEHFYHQFKIGDYTFSLNHYDTNTELLINDKNFKQLMKEERSGILDKEKQKHLRKQNHKDIYNNKDYELSDENIYDVDIKEQKRILEEFERKKKKEKEQVKNFYLNDEQMNKVEHNHKNNFVLDDKTVNKNRLIICNIENIFDSGDENEDNDEFNINDFTWDNNNNIHNQNVINQFFDFTKNNTNNNNINYQYPNISNIDNVNDNNIQNKKYNDDFNPFLD